MPSFDSDKIDSRDRRELLIPAVFLALSLVLISLPVAFQQHISSALRRSVLAPFVLMQEGLQQARFRAGEISQIQMQVDSLTAVLISQRTIREENTRLRGLLDLQERGGVGFVAASAVRPGTEGSESMFLLDVGTEQGVAVNDPVVVSQGLVGVVREVGPANALAMDWTHPDFRVSVMTEDGEAFGIAGPQLGNFREEDRLLLDGIPFYATVAIGSRVISSGDGSVYPRGILVGEVLEAAESELGWRKSYWLRPAVPPGSARHVLVMTGAATMPSGSFGALWGIEEVVDSLDSEPASAESGAADDADGEGTLPVPGDSDL